MHALMITFRSELALDDLEEMFSDYAQGLRRQPGLISKAWIADGSTLGGFHLFEGRDDVERYLSSDLASSLMNTAGFSDFEARTFEVLDDLSQITGVRVGQSLVSQASGA